MEEFCLMYNFGCFIKNPTYFKNTKDCTTIDHILTNHPRCFQSSGVIETGLSDIHRITLTVLKVYHSNPNPKIIQYRGYNNLTNKHFRRDLLQSYLFKTFNPMNLINSNLLPQSS